MADQITGLDIPDLIGPFVLGNSVASLLCGAHLVQATTYFRSFPQDRIYYKLTVTTLLLVSIGAWASQCHTAWSMAVTSRASPLAPLKSPSSIYVPMSLGISAQSVSQAYFAERSFRLCDRNKYVLAGFVLLILTTLVLKFTGLTVAISQPFLVLDGEVSDKLNLIYPNLRTAWKRVRAIHEADLVIGCCTDIIITAALAWKISGKRQGFRASTDQMIVRIISFTISTAFITSLWELVTAIMLFTTFEKHTYTYFFTSIGPHIYPIATTLSMNLRLRIDPNRTTNNYRPRGSTGNQEVVHGHDHHIDSAFFRKEKQTNLDEYEDPFPVALGTMPHTSDKSSVYS